MSYAKNFIGLRRLSTFISSYFSTFHYWSLIGDEKTIIEMTSDQVPKLIEDLFDQPSNVHEKMGP